MRISDVSSDVCSSDLPSVGCHANDGFRLRLYPSYGLRSGGVVRMQRIVAVHRGLGQHVAVHGAEHVAGGEAFGQVEPVDVGCEQAAEVAVHAERTDKRRVGKESGSMCRSRGWRSHSKKKE